MQGVTDAFDRIAIAAAPLFLTRGYAGLSLRDLADALGIKAASLYYHCPGGKRELYVRSLSAYLRDYRRRLDEARGRARFPAALFRLADWMLENPPVDAAAVLHAALEPTDEAQLTRGLHDAVLAPFAAIIEDGAKRGVVRGLVDPHLAAATVVALVHGLGFAHLPGNLDEARSHVHGGLKLLLDGLVPPRQRPLQ